MSAASNKAQVPTRWSRVSPGRHCVKPAPWTCLGISSSVCGIGAACGRVWFACVRGAVAQAIHQSIDQPMAPRAATVGDARDGVPKTPEQLSQIALPKCDHKLTNGPRYLILLTSGSRNLTERFIHSSFGLNIYISKRRRSGVAHMCTALVPAICQSSETLTFIPLCVIFFWLHKCCLVSEWPAGLLPTFCSSPAFSAACLIHCGAALSQRQKRRRLESPEWARRPK